MGYGVLYLGDHPTFVFISSATFCASEECLCRKFPRPDDTSNFKYQIRLERLILSCMIEFSLKSQ